MKAHILVLLLMGVVASAGFSNRAGAQEQSKTNAEANSVEVVFWQSIMNSKSAADYQAYLNKFPNGQFSELARLRIKETSEPVQSVSSPSVPIANPSAPILGSFAPTPEGPLTRADFVGEWVLMSRCQIKYDYVIISGVNGSTMIHSYGWSRDKMTSGSYKYDDGSAPSLLHSKSWFNDHGRELLDRDNMADFAGGIRCRYARIGSKATAVPDDPSSGFGTSMALPLEHPISTSPSIEQTRAMRPRNPLGPWPSVPNSNLPPVVQYADNGALEVGGAYSTGQDSSAFKKTLDGVASGIAQGAPVILAQQQAVLQQQQRGAFVPVPPPSGNSGSFKPVPPASPSRPGFVDVPPAGQPLMNSGPGNYGTSVTTASGQGQRLPPRNGTHCIQVVSNSVGGGVGAHARFQNLCQFPVGVFYCYPGGSVPAYDCARDDGGATSKIDPGAYAVFYSNSGANVSRLFYLACEWPGGHKGRPSNLPSMSCQW